MIKLPLTWTAAKNIGMTMRSFATIRRLVEAKFEGDLHAQFAFLVDYGEGLIEQGKKDLGETTIALAHTMIQPIDVRKK